jgi:hypothetical protein
MKMGYVIGIILLTILVILILILILLIFLKKKFKNQDSWILAMAIMISFNIMYASSVCLLFYYANPFENPYELKAYVEPDGQKAVITIDFFKKESFNSDAWGDLDIRIINSNGTIIWEKNNIYIENLISYHENINWTSMNPVPSSSEPLKLKCWFDPKEDEWGTFFTEVEFTRP